MDDRTINALAGGEPDPLLTMPYVPTVVHFNDSDALEYVSEDAVCVYEPIDGNCDLMRCMDTGKVVGFRLNSWKHHLAELQKQDALGLNSR